MAVRVPDSTTTSFSSVMTFLSPFQAAVHYRELPDYVGQTGPQPGSSQRDELLGRAEPADITGPGTLPSMLC
jgi:hypothetical protein